MRQLLRAGLTAATICLAVSSAHALPACAPVDFNGDCKSDILWRNVATGENYIYLLNGLTIASEGSLRTVADPNWTVAGTGDFNGDGKADILWRNAATGENYIFFLNGVTIASEGFLRTVDVNWTVAGIGDFNGDGKADILWRNAATGENYIFFLNGLTIASEGFLRTVAGQIWQVKGIGDYNGDGKTDILWRNTATGENYIYFLNGLTIASEGLLRTVADLNWITTPPTTSEQYAGLDVGAPALVGQTNVITAGSAYDVTAAGSDIFAASDQFHFAYKVQSGDFDLPVRVASLTAGANAWSKAGLMARETMAADSREVFVNATPAGGYEFQYRATAGALAQKVDSVQQVSYPNTWVRLKRAGNVFSSYTSVDGMTWTAFGTTTLALPATVFLGMATTSHNVAQTVLAQYRNLTAGSALPNTTPPSIPGGLTAVAVSGSQINLSWNASTDNVGVAGYKVLRGGVQIATTSALTYADTGLSPSTAYSYAVAAYDTAGNTSAPSSAASATTQAATPPSIPTGLSASAISASQINLSWSASTDPVGVTGYNVTRNGVLIAAVSVLTYADTGLSPSTTYPYTVAAFNAAGYTSAPSVAASATTPASAAPAQRPAYNTGTGFFILGKTLYDAAGYEFRIRGVNKAHYDSTQYDIVNNMKANAVRWNLYDAANTMSAQVAAARAWIAQKIVPIPGNWTGTCQDSPTYLTSIVDLWVAQAASWTTSDFQRYAIINIANEWGPSNSVVWRDSYITAIQRLRNAGYKQTLMIDSGGCGQDAADILKYAQAVFDSDPQKNVIFSLHIYGAWARPATTNWQTDYDTVLAQISQLNVPIVVGEFGPGRNIGPSPTPITPLEIMTTAEGYKWGWMAWAADDNDLANSMSDDGWFAMLYNNFVYNTSADLTIFGKVVVDNPIYGLKAIAVKAVALTGTPP